MEKIHKIDVDEKDGTLNCKIPLIGEYVFNRQPVLQQLWASSPLTGPKRFYMLDDMFYDTKNRSRSVLQYVDDEIKRIKEATDQ